MIDTHAHVNFSAYKDDFDAVIKRAGEKGIAMINIGSQISTSERAIELAKKYPKVFAAIGLHPIHLQDMEVREEGVVFTTRKEEFDYAAYRELAGQDKVVAIGETGLDYFHIFDEANRQAVIESQKKVFNRHIDLANDVGLPLIIHCRGTKADIGVAYRDLLRELKNHKPKKRGVLHCYIGPVELVDEFLDLGFYLGFNGVITFDKTGVLDQVLLKTPEERILMETDCPYLTPAPYRGKRNEPSYVEFVAEKIADVKKVPVEKVKEITTANAEKLFKITI